MTQNEENRLIAEKCEGMEVRFDEDQGAYVRFSHWLTPFRGSPDPCFIPLDDYFTDIAACVRAAEAWRKQDELMRTWRVESAGYAGSPQFAVRVEERRDGKWNHWFGFDFEFASTLATALVEAVK